MRLVGRESAVLAVALAGPRERERVVPREGDPAHAPKLLQEENGPASAGPFANQVEFGGSASALGVLRDRRPHLLGRLGWGQATSFEDEAEDTGREQRADDRADQVWPDAAPLVADQG